MVESLDSRRLPEWLEKWLKVPFYDDGEKCSTHHKQYNTNYCAACMKGPVCDTCCLQQFSKDHPHQILRVQVASRRAGIRVKDIEKILDVSKIELYSINNGTIVYLNPKKGAASDSDSDAIQIKANSCRTCRRLSQLKPGYQFCSIACKAEIKGADMVIEKFEVKFESESPSSGIDFVGADEITSGERLLPSPPINISTTSTTKIKNKEEEGEISTKRNLDDVDVDVDNKKNIHIHQFTPPLSFRKKSRKGIPCRAPFK